MKKLQVGDTIVEVMVAIVIAGLALGLAYQLSNSSLRSSTQATERSQALAFGSNQIERLKDSYYNSSTPSAFDTQYKIAQPYCLDASEIPDTNVATDCYDTSGFYYITIQYASQPPGTAPDTFTVTVTWPNINGHGNDNIKLYYRFPG